MRELLRLGALHFRYGKPASLYELKRQEGYWKFKKLAKTLNFKAKKTFVWVLGKAESSKIDASIAVQLMRVTFSQVLMVLLLLVVSLLADIGFEKFQALPVKGDMSYFSWINGLRDYISQHWTGLKSEALYNLLGTATQVSGAFLALYFTTVSLIASTAYVKVAGSVRAYILNDKVNRFYIGQVINFCVFSYLLLSICTANQLTLGPITLIFICVYGIYIICTFLTLGFRVFDLYDISNIVNFIARELILEVKNVEIDGPHWNEASHENHSRTRGEAHLNSLISIAKLMKSTEYEYVEGDKIFQVGQMLLSIQRTYIDQKTRIPTESYWYKRKLFHKDYLFASSVSLEMTLALGSSIHTEQKPDLLWVETMLSEAYDNIYESLDVRADLMNIAALTQSALKTVRYHSKVMAMDEAMEMCTRFHRLGSSSLKKIERNISRNCVKSPRDIASYVSLQSST